MLPSGIWWRTREPGVVSYMRCGEESKAGRIHTFFMVEAREEYGFDRACRH